MAQPLRGDSRRVDGELLLQRHAAAGHRDVFFEEAARAVDRQQLAQLLPDYLFARHAQHPLRARVEVGELEVENLAALAANALQDEQRVEAGFRRGAEALLGGPQRGPRALGGDAESQVVRRPAEQLDHVLVESAGLGGADAQRADDGAVQPQRQGQRGGDAMTPRQFPPGRVGRVSRDVVRHDGDAQADRRAGRPAPGFGFAPGDSGAVEEVLLGAPGGDRAHAARRVVLGIAHPGDAVAAGFDDGPAHFLQQHLFALRMQQRPVAGGKHAQRPVGVFQPMLPLLDGGGRLVHGPREPPDFVVAMGQAGARGEIAGLDAGHRPRQGQQRAQHQPVAAQDHQPEGGGERRQIEREAGQEMPPRGGLDRRLRLAQPQIDGAGHRLQQRHETVGLAHPVQADVLRRAFDTRGLNALEQRQVRDAPSGQAFRIGVAHGHDATGIDRHQPPAFRQAGARQVAEQPGQVERQKEHAGHIPAIVSHGLGEDDDRLADDAVLQHSTDDHVVRPESRLEIVPVGEADAVQEGGRGARDIPVGQRPADLDERLFLGEARGEQSRARLGGGVRAQLGEQHQPGQDGVGLRSDMLLPGGDQLRIVQEVFQRVVDQFFTVVHEVPGDEAGQRGEYRSHQQDHAAAQAEGALHGLEAAG